MVESVSASPSTILIDPEQERAAALSRALRGAVERLTLAALGTSLGIVVNRFAVDFFHDQAGELIRSGLKLDLPGLRLSGPDVCEVEDYLFEVPAATDFTVGEACDQ